MLTRSLVQHAPDVPGVYLFRDRWGAVLYVGKAKSLRRRLFQYTAPRAQLSGKTRRLVRRVASVELRPLGSELEALLLESRLIKEYQPPYNVQLRRFRRYPYLRLERSDAFPRLVLCWEIEDEEAAYYGPFPSLNAAQAAAELVGRLFPLRTCEGSLRPDPGVKPCYRYQLRRCGAPCAGLQSKEEYRAIVAQVDRFLRGDHRTRLAELIAQRQEAVERMEFERARLIQNRIELLQRYGSRFPYQVNAVTNAHLVVICSGRRRDRVQLLCVRSGRPFRTIELSTPLEREDVERALCDVYLLPWEAPPLDRWGLETMHILSQWLYANRHRQTVVRLLGVTPEACRHAAEKLIHLLGFPILGPLETKTAAFFEDEDEPV